jgi:histidinol dehydrogenase
MKLFYHPAVLDWAEILRRPEFPRAELEETVREVMEKVRLGGDTEVWECTRRFDKCTPLKPFFDRGNLEDAFNSLPHEFASALAVAAGNIEAFHEAQHEQFPVQETTPGVRCWRRSLPIERVGLYVPGGTAPLFSTLLMLAIPAKLAGCREIVVCSPPDAHGAVAPVIQAAAHVAGLDGIFPIGGAQAIAAMTFGTESIPRVDKLFGPGNQYVTQAKVLAVRYGVSIDIPAGPSEVAVLADSSASPRLVAADLLAQAEHGPDSHVLLVSDSSEVVELTLKEVEIQLRQLPRESVAREAISTSVAVVLDNLSLGMDLINAYAPEHLILCLESAEAMVEHVINAGSVFIGHFTPESLGDYASGTNHTLPTLGWARSMSGVSLDSFVKKITFQQASLAGLAALAETVCCLAKAEGLQGHANAVKFRLHEGE